MPDHERGREAAPRREAELLSRVCALVLHGGPGPVAVGPVRLDLDGVAADELVVATSGTTSRPRAVVRSAASWRSSLRPLTALTGLTGSDLVWLPGSLTSTLHLYGALHARHLGAGVVVTGPGAAIPPSATAAHLVPTVLARVLDDLAAGTPSALRLVVVAGSVLDDVLLARARSAGLVVVEYYGAAELSFVGVRQGAGLQAFPGADVELRDGVVWVRSPYLARGYLDPRDPGPLRWDGTWASVGDRAVQVDDGGWRVVGRAGTVTTGGASILVDDVERVLRAVPGVSAVAVLGVPHDRLGWLVAAVVVGPATRGELSAAVRSLPPAARPRRWWRAEALPLTASGKVARAELADRVARGASVTPLP